MDATDFRIAWLRIASHRIHGPFHHISLIDANQSSQSCHLQAHVSITHLHTHIHGGHTDNGRPAYTQIL